MKTTKVTRKSKSERSAAVKASWKNRKTRAARSARHNVKADGEIFRSVAQAFTALKLDLKPHQKVRRELVAAGRLNYKGHRFAVVH